LEAEASVLREHGTVVVVVVDDVAGAGIAQAV